MSVYAAIVALIGTPPAGYDIVVWVVCAVLLLYLITSAFSILASFIGFIAGKGR
jgi:hypothetical protein